MMQNADDQHFILRNSIEDAVTAMHYRPEAFAKFTRIASGTWMPTQQIKKFIEATHVGRCNQFAKLLETEGIDALQLDLSSAAKPQLYAFVPAVGQ